MKRNGKVQRYRRNLSLKNIFPALSEKRHFVFYGNSSRNVSNSFTQPLSLAEEVTLQLQKGTVLF